MKQFSINWYEPTTDDTLRRAQPGEVLRLSAWTGGRHVDTWYNLRITTEPETRTTWCGNVDSSIFRRREWAEFQTAFGELVFNHAKPTLPTPPPVWEVYPETRAARPACPVALTWRFEESGPHLSTACIWIGEPGQDPGEFRDEVLAAMPQPLTIDERFGLLASTPVQVLIAAELSRERNELARHLREQGEGRIIVHLADTADETLANLHRADVVIVADELPPRTDEKPQRTYCIGFIRDQLVRHEVPLVGWAVVTEREWHQRDTDPDFVMMHLRADCGRVLNGNPEPSRDPVHHVLDALNVPTTHKE